MSAPRTLQRTAIDKSIEVKLYDSSTFQPKTGLAHNSASLEVWYRKHPNGSPVQIPLVALANAQAAHTDGGFVAIDNTKSPGRYRIDLPDLAISSGTATTVSVIHSGIVADDTDIDVVDYDPTEAGPTEADIGEAARDTDNTSPVAGSVGARLNAVPTVVQNRTEMDSNSTKLATLTGDTTTLLARPSPPTAAAIRTEIDAASTQLAAILANTATLLGVSAPTVAAIRAEIDANSTKLATLVADTLALRASGYKKGVAVPGFMFPMRLLTGLPGAGLSVTVQISKDHGAFTTVGVAVESGNGWYWIALSGSDMTADEIGLKMTASGASQLDLKIRPGL